MTPEARQRSPFVTLLYFLLGLMFVVALVGGVGLYLFLRTDQGKKILEVARQGSALLSEAAVAPGTSELREIGCETALVVPAGKIVELFGQLEPQVRMGELERGFVSVGRLSAGTPVVFCAQKRGQAGTPDCASAARAYASAVKPPPERFAILMTPRRGDLAGCSGIYAPDGARVADLPNPDSSDPPAAAASAAP